MKHETAIFRVLSVVKEKFISRTGICFTAHFNSVLARCFKAFFFLHAYVCGCSTCSMIAHATTSIGKYSQNTYFQ